MTIKHNTPLLCARDGDTWTTTWREFAAANGTYLVHEIVTALRASGEWVEHHGDGALKVRVAR